MAKRSMFGSIQRLGEDRYRIYWTHDGQRSSKVVHGTRDDAELALATLRLGREGRVPDQPWASYYETVVKPTFNLLEPKTVSGYERVWRVELKPRIGKTLVGSTTRTFCQTILLDIRATSVQRAALRLWKKMCNMAIGDGLLASCPINRSIKLAPHVKREKHMLDVSKVYDFLDKIQNVKYRRVIRLMLGGGLSVEEACVITAEDVERWEQNGRTYALLQINKGLVTVEGKKLLKGAKNGFRERESVIGEPFASQILEDLPGEGPLCPGRLKCKIDGEWKEPNYTSPTTITHNWRDWCKNNKIDYIRPGDMRTIWSTWQSEAGSLDSLVSMAMGHADGTTRGRNYLMSTRRSMALIADNLTDLIEDATKKRPDLE